MHGLGYLRKSRFLVSHQPLSRIRCGRAVIICYWLRWSDPTWNYLCMFFLKDNKLTTYNHWNHKRSWNVEESRANKRAWYIVSTIIKVRAAGFHYMWAVMGNKESTLPGLIIAQTPVANWASSALLWDGKKPFLMPNALGHYNEMWVDLLIISFTHYLVFWSFHTILYQTSCIALSKLKKVFACSTCNAKIMYIFAPLQQSWTWGL